MDRPAQLLGYRARHAPAGRPFYVGINAIFIALYSLFTARRARRRDCKLHRDPVCVQCVGHNGAALWLRGPRLLSQLCRRWRFALGGAVLSLGAYGIVLAAMTVAPIAAERPCVKPR